MDYLTNIRWTDQSDSVSISPSTRRNLRPTPIGGERKRFARMETIMYDALGLPARPSFLALLGAGIVRALLWPARVIETRRTMSQLAGMTDFELRDIGLTRQDLADVTARPLDDDPTCHLASARAARARVRVARG
jgi:uncharacterized protein YjiS (DUF1127 family)